MQRDRQRERERERRRERRRGRVRWREIERGRETEREREKRAREREKERDRERGRERWREIVTETGVRGRENQLKCSSRPSALFIENRRKPTVGPVTKNNKKIVENGGQPQYNTTLDH